MNRWVAGLTLLVVIGSIADWACSRLAESRGANPRRTDQSQRSCRRNDDLSDMHSPYNRSRSAIIFADSIYFDTCHSILTYAIASVRAEHWFRDHLFNDANE